MSGTTYTQEQLDDAVAAEREACAQLVEQYEEGPLNMRGERTLQERRSPSTHGRGYAAAIRARGSS